MKKAIGGPVVFQDGRRFPLSQAVVSSGLIFVSGQLAMDKSNKIVGETVAEQTRQVLANISAILASLGAELSDVIKTTVWLTDAKDFAAFNDEYAKHFLVDPPARATVCSSLMLPNCLIEIEAIAAEPRNR